MGTYSSKLKTQCLSGNVLQISALLNEANEDFDINESFNDDSEYRNALCCCVESGSVEAVGLQRKSGPRSDRPAQGRRPGMEVHLVL